MSRIRDNENESINSDSFLDIVANIVGILIILIVIAGVRISQFPMGNGQPSAPSVANEDETQEPEVQIVAPANDENILLPDIDDLMDPSEVAPIVEKLPREEPNPYISINPPLPPLNEADVPEEDVDLVPNPELVTVVEQSEEQLKRIRQFANLQKSENGKFLQQIETLDQELSVIKKSLQTRIDQKEELQKTLDKRKIDLLLAKENRRKIQKLIDEEMQKQELASALKHTITPVAQVVSGKEIHFRLKDGKVSFVPIDELVETMKPQISRRREWIARYGTHQGKVGPIEGYSLGYIAARTRTTIANDLRGGGISLQIGVKYWEIIDSENVKAESEKEAIQPRSEFRQRLLSATNDTNITFWVYPDSFRIHRQLQDIARKYGYTVASRPLPDGIPIAASPNGSKSAAQ